MISPQLGASLGSGVISWYDSRYSGSLPCFSFLLSPVSLINAHPRIRPTVGSSPFSSRFRLVRSCYVRFYTSSCPSALHLNRIWFMSSILIHMARTLLVLVFRECSLVFASSFLWCTHRLLSSRHSIYAGLRSHGVELNSILLLQFFFAIFIIMILIGFFLFLVVVLVILF
jgi:hypothetical protein